MGDLLGFLVRLETGMKLRKLHGGMHGMARERYRDARRLAAFGCVKQMVQIGSTLVHGLWLQLRVTYHYAWISNINGNI